MTKYVAFLRGINVGGRIIKKDELISSFEKLGLKNVKTYLQSGNVVFESDLKEAELKNKIEEALTKAFNYPAKVWIIPTVELREIVGNNPFAGSTPDYHQYVIFFENGLEKDFTAEVAEQADEEVKAGEGVAYWKVQKGQTLKSERAKILAKSKYKNSTTNRNINTLKKIIV